MMGRSHAVSGAMAFAVAAPFLPGYLLSTHLSVPDVLLGSAICAGAALLPDADHPDGTIAHFLGPLTKALCRFVAWASGGHRKATHSFLFVALTWAAVWAGDRFIGQGFSVGVTFLLTALAAKATKLHVPGGGPKAWFSTIVIGAIGAVITDQLCSHLMVWLPYAVALGALAHLLGDCLTKQGAPLLWPHKERYEIVLIKKTGNSTETYFVMPVMAVVAVGMLVLSVVSPEILA